MLSVSWLQGTFCLFILSSKWQTANEHQQYTSAVAVALPMLSVDGTCHVIRSFKEKIPGYSLHPFYCTVCG